MKEANKIRLLLWGFIWIIILIMTVLGTYLYLTGHGKYGKIRKELNPIIKTFNKLDSLSSYRDVGITIDAKLKKDTIRVTYKSQLATAIYNFKYKEIDSEKVIYTKYNTADDNTAQIVISALLESIAINNNHIEGELFNKFEYNDFYDMSIEQGVKLNSIENGTQAYLNINKTLLDTITKEDIDNLYIKELDLKNINNELNETKSFEYKKGNTKLYIQLIDNKYIIYIRNGKYDDNLHKSIVSVIKSLNISDIIKNEFEISYPIINGSKEFGNYIITIDTDVDTLEYFQEKNNVVKIEIINEKTD